MFELDPKLQDARVVISWIPDADFFPDSVTFQAPFTVTAENYTTAKYSRPVDPNPSAILSGSPQLSGDSLSVSQLIVGGVRGCKYLLRFMAAFSDGVQRDGVEAVIEVT